MSEYGTWAAPPDEMSDGRPQRAWPQRTWLERTLGVSDRTGVVAIALMVGGLAVSSFVASLAYDWGRTTIDVAGANNDGSPAVLTYDLSPGSVDGLATVYVLMILALLGAIGIAVTWPSVAHRLRVAATGVGTGLIGILVAMTIRLPTSIGTPAALLPIQYSGRLSSTYEPGLYFGYATVVLCVVALWLAGPSPRRVRPAPPAPSIRDSQPLSTVDNGLTVSAESIGPEDGWAR